jgi:hypothetical protein
MIARFNEDNHARPGELYPVAEGPYRRANEFAALITGEFRNPLKGEYYLSGAIPEAWQAPNNLLTRYHICRIVRIEKRVEYIVKSPAEDVGQTKLRRIEC